MSIYAIHSCDLILGHNYLHVAYNIIIMQMLNLIGHVLSIRYCSANLLALFSSLRRLEVRVGPLVQAAPAT